MMLDERRQEEAQAGHPGGADAPRSPEKATPTGRGRSLADALRRARLSESERSDVILDSRDAESARLEMLDEKLAELFAEIPSGTDLLEGKLIPGSPPRLWVDVLAYVAMGRDKRTYRFVKESRYGPSVILESSNVDEMADAVTDYVAHRLIERARALESDTSARPSTARDAETLSAGQAPTTVPARRRTGVLGVLFSMLVGAVIGAAILFLYAYYLVMAG